MKSKTYEEFVEKFKPKKTTDDCYTPPLVYDTVKDWACAEYNIDPNTIVRPFWPGGDYEKFAYPDGCVVLDNPPFSILTKICEFYLDNKISFFLFAPSLTALSGKKTCMRMNHIICDATIEYENGAIIQTAFVTNLGDDVVMQTAPTLGAAVKNAVKELRKEKARTLPKYDYPDHVVTAAMMQRYSKYGVDFKVRRKDCIQISALDAQRKNGKTIFGAGLLLSDRAAAEHAAAECVATERAATERAVAERAAAERDAAHKWMLSDRERDIIASLG